jgi:hypothetical protein
MNITRLLWLFASGIYLVFLIGLNACGKKPSSATSAPTQAALKIHFTCDTSGRLEPCGCFTGQHGGLTRLRTWLRENDPAGTSLKVDVGGAIAGTNDYDLIQYRYLTNAYHTLGYHALNIGAAEAALSKADITALAADSPVPILSASWVDATTRQEILKPWIVIEKDQCKIGILGIISPHSVPSPGPGTEILSLNEAIDRHLPALREQCDVVVLLAFAKLDEMQKIAKDYFEISVILGGDVNGPAQQPLRENDSVLAWTTNDARNVGVLELAWDNSAGNKTMKLAGLQYQNQLLWDYIAQDTELASLMKQYREEIRKTKLKVDDPHYRSEGAIPGVSATATYVGTETCQSCHPKTHGGWSGSGHAHAFDTLKKKGTEADPHCISCHTVGFGKEGGYRRSMGDSQLIAVGCESCHGPGSLHVAKYRDGKAVNFSFRPLDAGDCTTCHQGEFSRPFDWQKFWPQVKHGKESTAPADGK